MRILELGCGDRPQHADSVRLDIRPITTYVDGRPPLDHVRNANDLGGIESGSFDRVIAKDLIEHLEWRHVPHALEEWLRVLKPGGTLEIETPNAVELAEQILRPQSAGLPRLKGESDWERFCRTAFGHQDYPENQHRCYFTAPWLAELLYAAGADAVSLAEETPSRFRLVAVAP